MAASYWPFIYMFREYFGWKAEDTERARPESGVEALKKLVEQGHLTEERYEEMGPLFCNLLFVQFDSEWDKRLEAAQPEQIKQQTFLALRDFVLALAKAHPVVFLLEDQH